MKFGKFNPVTSRRERGRHNLDGVTPSQVERVECRCTLIAIFASHAAPLASCRLSLSLLSPDAMHPGRAEITRSGPNEFESTDFRPGGHSVLAENHFFAASYT